MRLLLEGKNGNKNMTLENVKEYNESVHDRKIYVSYNDDRENESYSMIQYMAGPLNWLFSWQNERSVVVYETGIYSINRRL